MRLGIESESSLFLRSVRGHEVETSRFTKRLNPVFEEMRLIYSQRDLTKREEATLTLKISVSCVIKTLLAILNTSGQSVERGEREELATTPLPPSTSVDRPAPVDAPAASAAGASGSSSSAQADEVTPTPVRILELLTVDEFREMGVELPLDEAEAIEAIQQLQEYPHAEFPSEELASSVSIPMQFSYQIVTEPTLLPVERESRLEIVDIMVARLFPHIIPPLLRSCFRDGDLNSQEMAHQTVKAWFQNHAVIEGSPLPNHEKQMHLINLRDKYIKKLKWIAIAAVNRARISQG